MISAWECIERIEEVIEKMVQEIVSTMACALPRGSGEGKRDKFQIFKILEKYSFAEKAETLTIFLKSNKRLNG